MFSKKTLLLFVLLLFSYNLVAFAEETAVLSWPISCVPGIDCTGSHFRIGYPDVNGTGLSFACSKPGYLGHQGTDIVVSSVEQGEYALAAANGVVRWTKDRLFDHCPNDKESDCSEENKSELPQSDQSKVATLGFNAGNFVVIEHILGNERYLTLYAHLRNGSLKVVPGQRVVTGERLGNVASSGNSQIPHLHFGVYKAEGGMYRPVDPWKGSCNTSSNGLWAYPIPYHAKDLLMAHPSHSPTKDSEVYLQTIQRNLPKRLFY